MVTTNLHKIASEISISKRDSSESNLLEYILYGRDCLSELNSKGFISVRSVAIDIDTNSHSAKLPDDYMKFVALGICINGRIVELDHDDTLCIREFKDNFCCDNNANISKKILYSIVNKGSGDALFTYTSDINNPNGDSILVPHESEENPSPNICSYTIPVTESENERIISIIGDCQDECGCGEIKNADEVFKTTLNCFSCNAIPNSFNSYYNWNGIEYKNSSLDAIPTFPAYTTIGAYKIHNGRIYLSSTCGLYAEKIILKYKSSGVSETGQTEVPIILKAAIKAYIQWQIELNNPSSLSMVQIKWQEYKRQAKLLTSQEVLKGILDMLKAEMMHIYTGNLGR